LFAYNFSMATRQIAACSAYDLRRELSARSRNRSQLHAHEVSYGSVPSYIFQECEGVHGNFLSDSYHAIQAVPEWARRLEKAYTGDRWVPRRWERSRRELDCASSSDALLMNIFCYPGLLDLLQVCLLLGIERGAIPLFGYKPHTPMRGAGEKGDRADQTEVDMSLGPLLVEAKLTESGFQTAPIERMLRYHKFEEVFEIDELPVTGKVVQSYQLLRGVLAAEHLNRSFVVLCDARRQDLMEKWFQVLRAVRHCDLRSRLALLSWQELSAVLPNPLKVFLRNKYGICSGS